MERCCLSSIQTREPPRAVRAASCIFADGGPDRDGAPCAFASRSGPRRYVDDPISNERDARSGARGAAVAREAHERQR